MSHSTHSKVADEPSPHLRRGEKDFKAEKLENPDDAIEDNGASRNADMTLKVSLRFWQCWINLKSRRVLQSFVLAAILISLGFTVLTFKSYKSKQEQESHELSNTVAVFFKMDGEEKLIWEITEEKNIFEEAKDVTDLGYDRKVKNKDTLDAEFKVGAKFKMNEDALNGKDIDFVRRDAEARDSEEGTSDSPDLIISNRILNDRLRGEDFYIRFNQNSQELFDIKK